jgi:hypothetical protein
MEGRERHFELLMTPTKSKNETVHGFYVQHSEASFSIVRP